MWEFCVCLCFVMHYVVSILVLQSSWRGRESWLLFYYCLTDVLSLYMFCDSSSRCCGLICSVWLWYFMIILTFWNIKIIFSQLATKTWKILLLAHLSGRLRGELLVYQWLRRPSSVRPSSVCPSVNIFKHLLLWNHWANWTQISYGDSLGWGNESLFKSSWSRDQDGRHAHIW